jgi:hypothetical protein
MESTEFARLRQVAGKQTTRLTHYGRKTGKPHEVTIWFVLDGDRLYIGGQLWSKLTSNQSAAAAHCKGQSYIYSGGKAA